MEPWNYFSFFFHRLFGQKQNAESIRRTDRPGGHWQCLENEQMWLWVSMKRDVKRGEGKREEVGWGGRCRCEQKNGKLKGTNGRKYNIILLHIRHTIRRYRNGELSRPLHCEMFNLSHVISTVWVWRSPGGSVTWRNCMPSMLCFTHWNWN